jgi:hypothetical protein
MKAILMIFALLFSAACFSGEVTGVGKQALRVLKKNQMTVTQLKNQGLKILDGEVTGAGSRINLDRIQMLVTKNSLLKMKEISHIQFMNPSEAKSLKDVEHLEFDQKKVKPQVVLAIIYE